MTAQAKQQPTLPAFESHAVSMSAVRITNAGDGLSEALRVEKKAFDLEDEFFCVLRGTVTQVNHKIDGNDLITRVHTVKADAITEVDADVAQKMLQAAAEELERRKAALDGQISMDDEQAALDREALDATDSPTDIAGAAAKRAKNGVSGSTR